MKKVVKLLILCLFLVIPFKVEAISKEYKDIVYQVVGEEQEENKINIYLFYWDTCPHCKDEKIFLDEIVDKNKEYINYYKYESSNNNLENANLMQQVKTIFNQPGVGVPYLVIGENEFYGFSNTTKDKIEEVIYYYLGDIKPSSNYKIPLLGHVDVKNTSIGLIAVILGFIDGFNPCAMWILLFLINMLFTMKNKKKMLLYGFVFLFTSALVYFLSMLGISFILNVTAIVGIRILIAILALVLGILNINNYIKNRKVSGCHVVDNKKRNKIFTKINKFINEKNTIIAISGIILLAVSVNLVELACSVGFPAIYSSILVLNNITGITRIIYLIIYVLFYMLDDMIVFTIATITLNVSTRSTKYTKYVNLVSGIIMLLMGLLLIIKPEWIMFNF